MTRLISWIAGALVATIGAGGFGGCSNSGGISTSSLITGSVSPGASIAPAKVDDPATRPTKVAMVSAAAVRCGFYFDPGKLRQSLLTSQTADGVAGEQLTKAQQAYDNTYARFSKALATSADFCSESQVADIKSDLTRHLAGDFTTVAKVAKGPKQQSAWEWLADGGQKADAGKMDGNAIFFPSGGAQTTTPR